MDLGDKTVLFAGLKYQTGVGGGVDVAFAEDVDEFS